MVWTWTWIKSYLDLDWLLNFLLNIFPFKSSSIALIDTHSFIICGMAETWALVSLFFVFLPLQKEVGLLRIRSLRKQYLWWKSAKLSLKDKRAALDGPHHIHKTVRLFMSMSTTVLYFFSNTDRNYMLTLTV